MHPALSIVFFTTASGAGFALLLLLGLCVPLGLLPASSAFGFAALAVAFALAVAGSPLRCFTLGRPERAWRAFSQWRSSWLSREGVFSVLTFLPVGDIRQLAGSSSVTPGGWSVFAACSPQSSRRRRSIAPA